MYGVVGDIKYAVGSQEKKTHNSKESSHLRGKYYQDFLG